MQVHSIGFVLHSQLAACGLPSKSDRAFVFRVKVRFQSSSAKCFEEIDIVVNSFFCRALAAFCNIEEHYISFPVFLINFVSFMLDQRFLHYVFQIICLYIGLGLPDQGICFCFLSNLYNLVSKLFSSLLKLSSNSNFRLLCMLAADACFCAMAFSIFSSLLFTAVGSKPIGSRSSSFPM